MHGDVFFFTPSIIVAFMDKTTTIVQIGFTFFTFTIGFHRGI